MSDWKIRFGTAGTSDSFAAKGYKNSLDIPAYTAEMGGVDVITFTAGVGENDAALRREVCERLEGLGVRLNQDANSKRTKDPRVISADDSVCRVMVVPTNEELAIATQVLTVV